MASSVLSRIEIVCPISCLAENCDHCGDLFAHIRVPADEEESFYESTKQEENPCPHCKIQGFLEDPMDFAIFASFAAGVENCIGIRFESDFIDDLMRLLKDCSEEVKSITETTYAEGVLRFSFASFFHVFNPKSFNTIEFDFRKTEFEEENKAIIVSKRGLKFSCRVNGTPYETCFFNMEDLAALKIWLGRNKPSDRIAAEAQDEEESQD